jgi:cell division septation protein DedD
MEQFDIPHQRVREKNMYHLHLDAARIILISAAVIAIITVSFLLGMNINKKGESSLPLTLNHDILDGRKDIEVLKNNVPEPPDEEELSKPLEEKLAGAEKEEKKFDGPDKSNKFAKTNTDSKSPLTKDGSNAFETPEKASKKASRLQDASEAKKLSTAPHEDARVISAKKSENKNASRKKKNPKSKVIEVAGGKDVESKKPGTAHFAIQVASFDKKSTAQAESTALKEKKYDAYVDETKVGGKQYFRVRIGPIESKKQALDLLNTIQASERYQESYMVRE